MSLSWDDVVSQFRKIPLRFHITTMRALASRFHVKTGIILYKSKECVEGKIVRLSDQYGNAGTENTKPSGRSSASSQR